MANNALQTVISVVDKTAAPFILFEKRIHHALGPVNKLQKTLNRLARVSGFNVLKSGLAGVRDNASKAVQGVRNIAMSVDYLGRAIGFGLGKMQEVALRGDDLAKTSRRLGLSVESLQKFQHAADLAGVPVETMQESMRRMAVGAYKASRGVEKESKAFKSLGISVKNADGTLKTNEQILLEMSDKFAKAGFSATEKLFIANEVFGKSGSKMVELLNQGSEALHAQFEEMVKLGLMTEEEAKASEDYNDAMAKMRRSIDGLYTAIGGKLLPILTDTVEKLTKEFSENKDRYLAAVQPIIDSIPELAKSFTENAPKILSAIGGIMKFVGKFVDWFGLKWPLVALVAGSVIAPLFATVVSIGKILWMPIKAVAALVNYIFVGKKKISQSAEGTVKSVSRLKTFFLKIPAFAKNIFGGVLSVGAKFFRHSKLFVGFLMKSLPKLIPVFRVFGRALFGAFFTPLNLIQVAYQIWEPTVRLIVKNLDMIKSITFDDLIYCVKELDKSFDGLRQTLADIPLLGKILSFMGSLASDKVDFSGIGDGDVGSLMEEVQNPSLGAERSQLFQSSSTTKTVNNNTRSVFDVNFNNVPKDVSIKRHDYGGIAYGNSMQPAF